jgi:hypothetical protein
MMIHVISLSLLPLAFISGCAGLEQIPSNSDRALATDYCPQVIELLGKFDLAIAFALEDESHDALVELENTAAELVLLAMRAETEGVDLQALESSWMNDLKNASRALLTVSGGEANYLTEDERRNIMANILDDFEDSGLACKPSES